jgi:uncharacterized protein (TIGR03085 family)
MAATPVDARERAELCDMLLQVGPSAPTLCAGWDTLDLAAHLVVREHDLRAPLVILGGGRFAALEGRLMDAAKARGLADLVTTLRSCPPRIPWRLPGLRTPLNLVEWFVHHEDVRRAGGPDDALEPRDGRVDLDTELWAQLRRMSRLLLARLRGTGVELVAPGHGSIPARADRPTARLVGGPQELVLYLYGRREASWAQVGGDPDAVKALEAARLGI